jgi:O-antigen/teichoic acid export membrane protein
LETANIFSGGFIGYINMRLDNLLVAAALGPTGMSFYSMAWNASRAPVMVFSTAFSSVLMPTMARIQGDTERLKRAVSESLQHSYILLAPVSMAMFLYAGTIVPVVLGAKWTPMVPCLRVMAITILVAPLLYACQALFIVSRRAYLTSIPAIGHIVVLAVLMVPIAKLRGLLGAAFVDLSGVMVLTLTGVLLNSRLRRILTWKVFSAVLVPIGAAAVAGLLGYSIALSVPTGMWRDTLCLSAALMLYPLLLVGFGGRSGLMNTLELVRGINTERNKLRAVVQH